jgi:ATP-dependent protease ClpP protease subunit
MARKKSSKPIEIPVIGDVDGWERDVIRSLLEVPPGGHAEFLFDSSGGSVYGSLAALTLMGLRRITGTAVVLGECSSAALLLFAACQRRRVTRYGSFLFHHMHWESEKKVRTTEAVSWAAHFRRLEQDTDELLLRLFGRSQEQVRKWIAEDRYVWGEEMAEAGLAELFEIGGKG